MLLVVRDEQAAEAERVGRDHGVVAADGASRLEQPGLKAREPVGGGRVAGEHAAQPFAERPNRRVVSLRVPAIVARSDDCARVPVPERR